MELISQFGYHWFWFGLASVLLVMEMLFNRQFMFLCISFTASILGILTYLYDYVDFSIQLLFFVVSSAGLVWLVRSDLAARQARIDHHRRLVESRHYVGKELTLVSAIENGHSTQDLDGTLWLLKGDDCPAGSQVRVVDMGNDWLQVEPL